MPDDTEVKEVKTQPVVFTPALFWEPRKPTIFKGEPGQDPTKWLQEYLRVSKFSQWDDTLALANAYFFWIKQQRSGLIIIANGAEESFWRHLKGIEDTSKIPQFINDSDQ
ncbi:hypothetical protein AVEN_128629-1 [Araneus ventricosus]|uniref:Uncharacterized protein n=1 Tax=Araneus ventricosus TaxID=182803 RepID=A0A4Y2KLU6_ARAVE|nr:hypothetical protein AVEN_128629-1 [Araneus ventricosus]